MKLSEWEKNLLTEEVCRICRTHFEVELMKQIGQLRIKGVSGLFVFYNLVCSKIKCPFSMTVVMIRTQRLESPESLLEAIAATKTLIAGSRVSCGTCGTTKLGNIGATLPNGRSQDFQIRSFCQVCETKNTRDIRWRVVNPLDMLRKVPLRTPLKEDHVLDAHEVLKSVSFVGELFR